MTVRGDPNARIQEVVVPHKLKHLSFSQLQTFTSCGRKWQLEKLEDAPRIPQGAFHGGSSVHDAIEWAEKNEVWKDETAEERLKHEATVRFEERVEQDGGPDQIRWAGRKSKQYPGGEDYQWWLFHLGVFTKRWLELRRLWDFEGVKLLPDGAEMKVRAPLPSGVSLDVRIDALFVNPDGELSPTDYKAGQKGSGNILQLAIAAWLVGQTRGLTITKGQFVYLRGPQIDTHDLTSYLPLVPKLFGDLERAIEAESFIISPSNFCISCPVRLSCEYGKLLPRDDLPEVYR